MRPKIKTPLKFTDVILEIVCITVYVLLCIYLILSFPKLPDTIATHYGISGRADGFGSKYSLLFHMPISLILYVGLSLLQKYPHIYNYLVEINEKNALVQYTYAVKMIRVLKLLFHQPEAL